MPESQLASYFQRPIIWLNNIALYLKNLLYPLRLSAVYGLPVPYLVHQWWFYILPIVPISLAFGLYFIGKKRQILLLAGSLFLLGFLPTSGLVSFSFQLVSVVADRYLYFAFIGISLAISVVAERKNFSIILAIILLIFTLISAFKQIPVWQNELKLWNYAVSHAQYDKYYAKNALASAWHNEGWDLARRGETRQALAIFDKIIANKFNHKLYFIGNTFYLRGVIMMQQKHYQKALSDFDKSIASKHKNSNSDEGKIGSHEGKIAVFTALRQCENASFEIDFMRKNKLKIPVFLLTDFHKNCPKPLPPRID
ncbi:MAG: hypothetical protein HAW58_06895 [Candidatus Thioglobus sp.]|nr:hypothetical protein [Candidatus Thioglobus sp.]